jgi:hypothetical protein
MFSVYGRMTALPGRRDELIALLLDGFRAGGDDSGLLAFSINKAFDDPDAIWLTHYGSIRKHTTRPPGPSRSQR